MIEMIDISIVIVSYNTKNLLVNCLKSIFISLEDTTLKYEVIVVDNKSTDGTPTLLKNYPQIITVFNKQNVGFGKANNQGIKRARGKYILFLNSDIEVLDKAIEKLYLFHLQQNKKTITGGKLLNIDKTPQSSCGPGYTILVIFLALFLKGDYLNITRYSPDFVKKVDWVMGACMMMSNNTFNEVGWFDEGIFMYMEEIDFQYRAKKVHYQIIFYPEAQFIHLGAGSSQGREAPILNVFNGFLYFYKKHRSYLEYRILRVLLVLKSILAIVFFILMNKKDNQLIYKKALLKVISY